VTTLMGALRYALDRGANTIDTHIDESHRKRSVVGLLHSIEYDWAPKRRFSCETFAGSDVIPNKSLADGADFCTDRFWDPDVGPAIQHGCIVV
jgi:hypothetical protein